MLRSIPTLGYLQRVSCSSSHLIPGNIRSYEYRLKCLSKLSTYAPVQKEDVVIVGGGVAGLATSLALHRLGIPSLVLEQSDSLRKGGTSLTLFTNGWRVLDVLGVGNDLRSQYLEIQGLAVKTVDGKLIQSVKLKDVDQSGFLQRNNQELRAVERRTLLQALADQLPANTVQYSSKLAKIEKDLGTGETKLELVNGTQLSAKIVIGCDGVRSPIAKWMGFREPKYSGHCAIRGLAFYPEGQPYQSTVNYSYGRGQRAGFVPISPNKVYWFIIHNNSSPGPRVADPHALKKQALDLVRNWPSEVSDIIGHSPVDTIIHNPLEDRWLWPGLTPPVSKGNVVLIGDAWHPMTPNLGQGACCALEDAIVLSKKLHGAMKLGQGTIQEALRSFGEERWSRIFSMTIRSNLVGKVLQWENPLLCSLRDGYIVPKLVKIGPMLEHTKFDCEPL